MADVLSKFICFSAKQKKSFLLERLNCIGQLISSLQNQQLEHDTLGNCAFVLSEVIDKYFITDHGKDLMQFIIEDANLDKFFSGISSKNKQMVIYNAEIVI